MHLIIDAHAKNVGLMIDREQMKEWLFQVAKMAGMSVFAEPFIYGFPWPGSGDYSAITAFCPLMESGLVVHCWPEKEFVFIDLFTCGEMERETEERVVDHIVGTFQMIDPKIIPLERGIDSRTGEVVPARLRQPRFE